MTETCQTCRFFLAGRLPGDLGRCRRHAPKPDYVGSGGRTWWPSVDPDSDWCAEHEPAPAEPPPGPSPRSGRRDMGHYHARMKAGDQWTIAFWLPYTGWLLPGEAGVYTEEAFSEIHERPIVRDGA